MFNRNVSVAIVLGLATAGAGAAQQQTLNLEFGGDVYISHVSEGLQELASYRQTSVTTTQVPTEDGEVAEQGVEEVRAYVAESGERAALSRFDLMPGMTMTSGQYIVGGRGFAFGGSQDDLSCQELPASSVSIEELETQVADATGFKSATLAAAGETVNGLLTDRYTLDKPPYAGRFEDGSLEGQLWLAREGGFIVKYEVIGSDSSGTTTIWRYDLTDVGSTQIALPEECAAL